MAFFLLLFEGYAGNHQQEPGGAPETRLDKQYNLGVCSRFSGVMCIITTRVRTVLQMIFDADRSQRQLAVVLAIVYILVSVL